MPVSGHRRLGTGEKGDGERPSTGALHDDAGFRDAHIRSHSSASKARSLPPRDIARRAALARRRASGTPPHVQTTRRQPGGKAAAERAEQPRAHRTAGGGRRPSRGFPARPGSPTRRPAATVRHRRRMAAPPAGRCPPRRRRGAAELGGDLGATTIELVGEEPSRGSAVVRPAGRRSTTFPNRQGPSSPRSGWAARGGAGGDGRRMAGAPGRDLVLETHRHAKGLHRHGRSSPPNTRLPVSFGPEGSSERAVRSRWPSAPGTTPVATSRNVGDLSSATRCAAPSSTLASGAPTVLSTSTCRCKPGHVGPARLADRHLGVNGSYLGPTFQARAGHRASGPSQPG